MFHKTFQSYQDNDPWDKEEEHPDGLLWLVTVDEFNELHDGMILETVDGKVVVKGKNKIKRRTNNRGYMDVGIRGIKND
jgi:hypothetical protein